MAAISYTDRGAVGAGAVSQVLMQATFAALQAPSIRDTQPWRWRIDADRAELHADRNRQLCDDPDGRLLVVSCGATLHHAHVVLAAEGVAADVLRFPDLGDPDLLAILRYNGPMERAPRAQRLRRAIAVRRSDQRPFADDVVSDDEIAVLRAAAQEQGVGLDALDECDLAEGAERAGRYLALATAGDTPADWLAAGEALSAVLLAAAADGLVTSPVRDLAATASAVAPWRRPVAVVRVGVPGWVAASPRHRPADVAERAVQPRRLP